MRARSLKGAFSLLLFLILVVSVSAQPALLQGEWKSSDGVRLVVGETGTDGTFSIGVYSPDGKHYNRRVARWDEEIENRFHYQIDSEEVRGTFFPEDRRLELSDAAGTWKTLWLPESE